jgi:hypothetical protein
VRIRIKLNININLTAIKSSKIDTNDFKTSFWAKVVLHVKCIWILRQIRQIYYGFIGSPIFHYYVNQLYIVIFYWLYCSLWASWLTIKHLFVVCNIPYYAIDSVKRKHFYIFCRPFFFWETEDVKDTNDFKTSFWAKVVLHVKCIWILRQIRQIYYGFIGSPIFHWFFYDGIAVKFIFIFSLILILTQFIKSRVT